MDAVIIRPGDMLVVSVAHELSEAAVAQLREQHAEAMPGVKLVLLENVTGLAVFRPGESD